MQQWIRLIPTLVGGWNLGGNPEKIGGKKSGPRLPFGKPRTPYYATEEMAAPAHLHLGSLS